MSQAKYIELKSGISTVSEIGLPFRYRIDEFNPKKMKWDEGVMMYRDCERHLKKAEKCMHGYVADKEVARCIDMKTNELLWITTGPA